MTGGIDALGLGVAEGAGPGAKPAPRSVISAAEDRSVRWAYRSPTVPVTSSSSPRAKVPELRSTAIPADSSTREPPPSVKSQSLSATPLIVATVPSGSVRASAIEIGPGDGVDDGVTDGLGDGLGGSVEPGVAEALGDGVALGVADGAGEAIGV